MLSGVSGGSCSLGRWREHLMHWAVSRQWHQGLTGERAGTTPLELYKIRQAQICSCFSVCFSAPLPERPMSGQKTGSDTACAHHVRPPRVLTVPLRLWLGFDLFWFSGVSHGELFRLKWIVWFSQRRAQTLAPPLNLSGLAGYSGYAYGKDVIHFWALPAILLESKIFTEIKAKNKLNSLEKRVYVRIPWPQISLKHHCTLVLSVQQFDLNNNNNCL